MTETVKAAQDETNKDSTHPSPPSKSSKIVKITNDGNERPKQSEKTEKPPTKIVVRRLPPTMTLETFVDQVSPLPPVDFMYFVKADSTLAPHSFCRAYLHFIHVDDMLIFTEKFDNYVFVDGKGNEFPAIVEYAPFQRIPKQRSTRKKDPRIGTIEGDPYFQEFIDALKAEEAQRKSASKTNKQHFFETSASPSVQKITTTPLLEFLKNRRADKLRSKEDRIAERRKREVERRKARDEIRSTSKQMRSLDGDGDAPATPIKIAGHGVGPEKTQKDATDSKKSFKVAAPPSRQEKERKDKDLRKDSQRDLKKDARDRESKAETESISLKDTEISLDKSKENISVLPDSKPKDVRKTGKSYQEDRQRLNERRLAAKAMSSKASSNDDGGQRNEKEEKSTSEDSSNRKMIKKDGDASLDSKSRASDKVKGPDNSRLQNTRDIKKADKFSKPPNRDQDQRRFDGKKNADNYGEKKEVRKSQDEKHFDASKNSSEKPDQSVKSTPLKEEVRKKSYNQEREQRRAADRKTPGRKDSTKTDDTKATELKEVASEKSSETKTIPEEFKGTCEADEANKHKGGGDGIDNNSNGRDTPNDESHKGPLNKRAGSEDGDASSRRTDIKSKADEKDKKDPRAERRIRNKDRPSIEIYRPGMGRFSRQRLEREKGLNKGSSTERDSPSSSPSPIPHSVTANVVSEK